MTSPALRSQPAIRLARSIAGLPESRRRVCRVTPAGRSSQEDLDGGHDDLASITIFKKPALGCIIKRASADKAAWATEKSPRWGKVVRARLSICRSEAPRGLREVQHHISPRRVRSGDSDCSAAPHERQQQCHGGSHSGQCKQSSQCARLLVTPSAPPRPASNDCDHLPAGACIQPRSTCFCVSTQCRQS